MSLFDQTLYIFISQFFDYVLNVFHLCLLSPFLYKKTLMIKREYLILHNCVNSSFFVFEIHSWPAFTKNFKPDKQESPWTWWFLLILSTLLYFHLSTHSKTFLDYMSIYYWCVAVEPNLFSLQGESFWHLQWCSWTGFPCHFHKGDGNYFHSHIHLIHQWSIFSIL